MEYTKGWFIGQFENGSWGFQQCESTPPRYTSKYEAECIKNMYEALKGISGWLVTSRKGNMPNMDSAIYAVIKALAKAEPKGE